jgi:uncharacterized membrane protein YphA (DoxX/SURF4 family)
MFSDQYLVLLARTFVALILLAAGVSKLGKRREFIEVVRDYKVLPESLAGVFGRLLPFVEVFVAACLLGGVLMPWSALAAAGLFLSFGVAIAINLLRGRRDISCGCFGQHDHQLTWPLFMRAIFLACLSLVTGRLSLALAGTERLSTAEATATMLTAATVLASWYLWSVTLTTWRLQVPEKECCGSRSEQPEVKR